MHATTGEGSTPVVLLISLIFVMEVLDASIVTTLLPQIAKDVGVSPIDVKAAMTYYFLVVGCLISASSWLADRFGGRTILCGAILLFTLGSVLCAAAHSLSWLITARVLQGVGTAMIFPVGRAIIAKSVSKDQIVRTSSYMTLPSALAPIFGLLLAGVIGTYSSWRIAFFINLPLGLVAFFFAHRLIPDDALPTPPPFDRLGFVLSSGAIVAWGYLLTAALGPGANLFKILGVLLLALLLTAAYWRHYKSARFPVLNLSLFEFRTFRVSLLGSFFARLVIVGALPFLVPMLLQLGLGLTPLVSALISIAGALAVLSTKFLIEPMIKGLGFRKFLVSTSLIGSTALLMFALVGSSTPALAIATIVFVGSLFRVLLVTGFESLIFEEIDRAAMGQATSLLSVSKQLSAYAGVFLAGLVLQICQTLSPSSSMNLDVFRAAVVFMALPLLSTVAIVLFLRAGDGSHIAGRK